jgi:hypothetical protein
MRRQRGGSVSAADERHRGCVRCRRIHGDTQPLLVRALSRPTLSDHLLQVERWVSFNGSRGAVARSQHAVVLDDGRPKRAYYVEGGAYEMGFLMGLLAPNETS